MGLSPGKEGFLQEATDLPPELFRRLVGRRARQILQEEIPIVPDEGMRRELESRIDRHFEKIHLGADFLPVRFLADGAKAARAVCRISTRTSHGSGFLIAPGYLMTNNHVLNSRRLAEESVAEFSLEEGQSARVAAIEPGHLFVTDQRLDFTVVACDRGPVSDIDPMPLLRNPATVTRNERVNIIQHPRGRPKEIAIHNNKVTRVKDRVLLYETDTEPGSSGSPVLNNDWELVAIHHAGYDAGGGRATNEGVRMSAIVAHLLQRRGEVSENHEALRSVLSQVKDTSPYLGFFDTYHVEGPDPFEVELPDYLGSPDFADVGFWNIEHFNNRVSEQRVEDVADVVSRLAMDVLGLVEVQDGAMQRLAEALRRRGDSADFVLLDVPRAQDLAVLYDQETATVKLRDDLNMLHKDRLNSRTSSGRTAFPRHPLFAECRVEDGNGPQARFLMLIVHLKAYGDAQSRERRRLASEILAEIIEDIRQEDGLPVVLGGDFNERLDTQVLGALKTSPDLFALTADDASVDAISYVGSSHRSLIDHIIVSRDVRVGDVSGDDAAIVRLDRSARDFASRVSDHVPLVFRMIYRDEPLVVKDASAQTGGG